MLASWRKGFVPVEVTIKSQFLITVRSFAFCYVFTCFARFDAGEPGGSSEGGLGTYFEVGEGGGADVALHTGRVPALFEACKRNYAAFDWEGAGVTCRCGSCTNRCWCW